ncbi:hypothetical protein [Rhizobium sp. Root482]|uniref:hypothetical protein n=1 Tax=Rhizobium sp. Root482 TaxID=1736543 RepID=UPI000701C550|nr:hypothetical protein [Rhizobium sp. Root482]KQY14424.1 hypothetical protein ASD31_09150 [Rhizobium sp. Root482]
MEDEATIPETGTALDVNEAANLISQMNDQTDDSVEQTEAVVEEQSTEVDETPEEQFVDIDGNQISLTEIRNSYLRQQDYTRKTQEIAEQRKHYQENQRDINELRNQALENLETLKQQVSIEFRMAEVPDFDYLAENDPGEYVRQKALWEKRENAVRQLYETEMHLKQKAAEYEAEQHKAALQESNARFYEKYPELKDAAKSNEVFGDITQYLLDTGFSEQEIRSVSDHRIIDILYQNVKAQKAQKSIPAVVEKINKKPVLSAKQPSQKTDFNRQNFEKFNNSRSVADAAALIKNLL